MKNYTAFRSEFKNIISPIQTRYVQYVEISIYVKFIFSINDAHVGVLQYRFLL